jgi:hypothetical protein
LDKKLQITFRNLKGVDDNGEIRGPGHQEDYAIVHVQDIGEITVPRHHIKVRTPAGRQNKVAVIRGEHLGKVGVVESTAVRYKGKWLVREHLTKAELVIHPTDLGLTRIVHSIL